MSFRKPTIYFLSLVAMLAFASCAGDDGLDVGTETNWLKICETDAECGQYSCECGVCTNLCEGPADCDQPSAICSPSSADATQDLCAKAHESSRSAGLCLADQDSQGSGGATMGSGGGNPSGGGDGGESMAGGSASGGGGSGGGASGGSASGGQASGGQASGGSSSGGGSSGLGGEGGLACPDAEPPILGCCWTAADCETGQDCYMAADPIDCLAPPVGRCMSPPSAGCIEDRDCDEGEECFGSALGACGSLEPNATGYCIPNTGPSCGNVQCAGNEVCCDRCNDQCKHELSGAYCPEDSREPDFVCEG